jgi:thiamine pyrophosphate-dependent acetolactate synthase large subunit-like protein
MLMTSREALEVLALHRRQRIVLTTMTAVGIWPNLSDTGLDFNYIPSSMGQGPSLALGLALSQPERGVIVVCGDGSLLMNLGSLVTLTNHPAEVFVIVMDNGIYEVTGGQPHAGERRVDYCGVAKSVGIQRSYTFATLEAWRQGAAEALSGAGPVLIHLSIEARMGQATPKAPRPMQEQIARLQKALGVGQ